MLWTLLPSSSSRAQVLPTLQILPKILELVASPLLQGLALDAVQQLLVALCQTSVPGGDFQALRG